MAEQWPVELTGRVRGGFGKGAYFVTIDWVQAQLQAQLGFIPYPGTLNVELSGTDLAALTAGQAQSGRLTPPDGGCGAVCLRVTIGGSIPGAIVMPDTTDHAPGYIEMVAPVRVREALGLGDGDTVTVRLEPATGTELF